MKKILISTLLLIILTLASCNEYQRQPVDWYQLESARRMGMDIGYGLYGPQPVIRTMPAIPDYVTKPPPPLFGSRGY